MPVRQPFPVRGTKSQSVIALLTIVYRHVMFTLLHDTLRLGIDGFQIWAIWRPQTSETRYITFQQGHSLMHTALQHIR